MDTTAAIRKKLGHLAEGGGPALWLDTGVEELNTVIGHRLRGIPYGRIIEISGIQSHGKTAIALAIAALGQRNGAHITWQDLENSWESDWSIQRGIAACPACKGSGRKADGKHCGVCAGGGTPCNLCSTTGKLGNKNCPDCLGSGETRGLGVDSSKLSLVQPYVGQFGKEKGIRLSTGPELLMEAEAIVTHVHKSVERQILVVDSVPSILPEGEATTGLDERNMKTNMELPILLSGLLRRWMGFSMANNLLIIFVNQLRKNPMARFGSPWYEPGGNALPFYAHIRVRVNRVMGSKILEKGKTVGIKGLMTARKNKIGGAEGAQVGYKIMFKGPIHFVPSKDVAAPKKEASDDQD